MDDNNLKQLMKALEAGGYNAAPGCDHEWGPIIDLHQPCLKCGSKRSILEALAANDGPTRRCECGADKCGGGIHSDWCPKCSK